MNKENIKHNLLVKIDFYVRELNQLDKTVEINKNAIDSAKNSNQIINDCIILKSSLWILHLEIMRDTIKEEVKKLQKDALKALEEELRED